MQVLHRTTYHLLQLVLLQNSWHPVSHEQRGLLNRSAQNRNQKKRKSQKYQSRIYQFSPSHCVNIYQSQGNSCLQQHYKMESLQFQNLNENKKKETGSAFSLKDLLILILFGFIAFGFFLLILFGGIVTTALFQSYFQVQQEIQQISIDRSFMGQRQSFNPRLLQSASIFKKIDKFAHASTILKTSHGTVLVCYFYGNQKSGQTRILCQQNINQLEWSDPYIAVDQSFRAGNFVGNPVLFQNNNIIYLLYQNGVLGSHFFGKVYYKFSKDNGKSWSKEQFLIGSIFSQGTLPRDSPVKISEDLFLIPLYRQAVPRLMFGIILKATVSNGLIKIKQKFRTSNNYYIQPSLIQTSQNQVLAYVRNIDYQRVLVTQLNFITGQSSPLFQTNVQSKDSFQKALIYKGNILLIHDNRGKRKQLILSASSDALNFSEILQIFNKDNESSSYPSAVIDKDSLLITFSRNYRQIQFINISLA